ncbi:hypothetical protein CP556_10005 [Natrinema sp. CBA1119]|uniref:hypothetical protein n=1 Tax=Natrinema sp. CBA1119 TaxID=1608465 RepID=UPI000BF92ED2|nr:hypothetical protein [Natrinema sp. CBA1119]PGF16417.1 hypothetical protein CP556_10005 [Natrinema sp. CBA1119]
MNRRPVLYGSGAVFIPALAGCSSDETDADSDGDGDDDEPETVVDVTIATASNYSVDADAGDVISVDVTGYDGGASIRIVNVDGAVESIYRETVEADASFDVAIEDAGTYEIRADPDGKTKIRARLIRS